MTCPSRIKLKNEPTWVEIKYPANFDLSGRTRGMSGRAAINPAKEFQVPILSDDKSARQIAKGEERRHCGLAHLRRPN